jgi:serpin B
MGVLDRVRYELRFAAVDGVQLVELVPDRNVDAPLAMTLVLPDQVDGLDAVEARLSQRTFDSWIGMLTTYYDVALALPAFEMSQDDPLRLGKALKALGMPLAFEEGKADFSGMTEHHVRVPKAFLAEVLHKSLIKFEERNFEGKIWPPRLRYVDGGFPKVAFQADHPFLFFIRDTRSGMILFMGRVADPKWTPPPLQPLRPRGGDPSGTHK